MSMLILEHESCEIVHIKNGKIRQTIERLRCVFGRGTGCAEHMFLPSSTRNVDAAMDRVNPGRAGKRVNHTSGAENGNAAGNAEARVPCFLGDLFPARH